MVILPLLCKGPYRVAFLLQIAADQMVYFRKNNFFLNFNNANECHIPQLFGASLN